MLTFDDEKNSQYIIMKSRTFIIMYFVIAAMFATMIILYVYGGFNKVEKYTRDELQKDLDNLLTELEKDGLLSQEITDVPA